MVYSFECEKCGHKFDLQVDMDKIVGYKPKCPSCKSSKTYRDYGSENVTMQPPIKTLGAWADKNKMSGEAQAHILNQNKKKDTKLPEGVTRYERDSTGKHKL